MDEIGFQMSHSQKENMIFNRTIGPPKAVMTEMTAWVSTLECISMDGRALSPLVIHYGHSLICLSTPGFHLHLSAQIGITALPKRAGSIMIMLWLG